MVFITSVSTFAQTRSGYHFTGINSDFVMVRMSDSSYAVLTNMSDCAELYNKGVIGIERHNVGYILAEFNEIDMKVYELMLGDRVRSCYEDNDNNVYNVVEAHRRGLIDLSAIREDFGKEYAKCLMCCI